MDRLTYSILGLTAAALFYLAGYYLLGPLLTFWLVYA